MEILFKTKIKIPMVPNYVFSEEKNVQYSVSEFTDEQLKEIGRQWTENLIKRAKEQRKNK